MRTHVDNFPSSHMKIVQAYMLGFLLNSFLAQKAMCTLQGLFCVKTKLNKLNYKDVISLAKNTKIVLLAHFWVARLVRLGL